ncbi:MAG: DegT/DnrJ/EryC1/StrS aminotransferase family protein, partial [Burkholderiales bacterium]|nr:DegT/DnrJ/EryC1/StrS aminotransferase family protein [Burkholderiales bacterium]
MLTYSLFDPSACGYGTPKVPLLPRLTAAGLGLGAATEFAPIGAGRPRAHYRYGRYALTQAYALSGVGSEGALLAPAYHCRTMIDPALHLQAPVLLYPLDEALCPDLAALERLRLASARPVKALLLTHYFGFAQPRIDAFQRWCDTHGIALIEDCSHALFNRQGAERLGQAGRYTIASPYKFFPCEEAGWLVAGRDAAWPPAPR